MSLCEPHSTSAADLVNPFLEGIFLNIARCVHVDNHIDISSRVQKHYRRS